MIQDQGIYSEFEMSSTYYVRRIWARKISFFEAHTHTLTRARLSPCTLLAAVPVTRLPVRSAKKTLLGDQDLKHGLDSQEHMGRYLLRKNHEPQRVIFLKTKERDN